MYQEPINVAFKEWSIVCHALGSGRQSIVLRKGGIHEGKKGFQFEHKKFALFPTRFHEQDKHVRVSPPERNNIETEYQIGETVSIQHWAQVESLWTLRIWESIDSLSDFHIWDEPTIFARYNWANGDNENPAINLALIRVFKFPTSLKIPYSRQHSGCRSWVNIPPLNEEEELTSVPVLEDFEFGQIKKEIEKILTKNGQSLP